MTFLDQWIEDLRAVGPGLAIRVYPRNKKCVRIRVRSPTGAATAWYRAHGHDGQFDVRVDPDPRFLRRCDGIRAGTVILRALTDAGR